MKYLLLVVIAFGIKPACSQKNIPQVSNNFDLDSVKWKMYLLTYDIKLAKRRFDDSPSSIKDSGYFSSLMCNIKVISVKAMHDSVEAFLDFFLSDSTEHLIQKDANSVIGVGYIKNLNIYYPIFGKSAIDESPSYFKSYFTNKERLFVSYLKTYKLKINPWLKDILTKKQIL